MSRKLGIFEKAMLIANQHAPFNIVSVLRIENAPAPDIVGQALISLQQRHPFLRSRIVAERFEIMADMEAPLQVVERNNSTNWRKFVETEMAHSFNHETGPLFRATYLFCDGSGDLVLNVHHAIIDAVSGMNLLDEFLQLCSGEITERPPLQLAPACETVFPPSHQGMCKIVTMTKYTLSQMVSTMDYMWRTRAKRRPPVRFGGKGRVATMVLEEELVDALSSQARKSGVTINSILNAALVWAVNRHLYNGETLPMQTFSFADLRPYTEPPASAEHLANYISMMQFTADLSGEVDFWALAQDLHTKIYKTLKSGDKFSASLMSESLLKIFTKMKMMRFGSTAINYSGNVPLKMQYGNIKLVGLHGFVSGYDLAPELASQARLFDDEIWWDFIYLESDMDADLAEIILAEIKQILQRASQN